MSSMQNQISHGLSIRSSKEAAISDPSKASSVVCEGFSHPYHPNCPDSLNCLVDTDEKPNHILSVIVRSAILGSTTKKLTLRGIFTAIEEKWPYYRTVPSGWKDSIRHNLSLNTLFKKVPRPSTESGYGSYWTVDFNARPGSKRARKRRAPAETASGSCQGNYATSGDVGAMIMPPFRLSTTGFDPIATHLSRSDSGLDGDPEDLQSEYEVEEVTSNVPDAKGEYYAPSPIAYPESKESGKEKIGHLEEQLLDSQRQSQMTSAFALRLSQQLEEAREDASRAKVKLQTAREQLEEELVARMQVEKRLDEEEKLRKEAERQLKNLLQAGGPGSKLFEAIKSIQEISKNALGN